MKGPHFFQVLAKVCLLVAAFALFGGHWAVLQSIAWTGMLWNYTQESGWRNGLEKTFSGEAPCALCKSIARVREAEQKEKSADLGNPESLKAALVQAVSLPPRLWGAAAGPCWRVSSLMSWVTPLEPPPPRGT